MEEDVKTLGDYISIAWRRKFHILIPFVLILAVTVVTVFVLPPVYRSTGTILIEAQQIPEELIQSTVTSFADERIQVIKQRIMTSQQLFEIIKKFDLYANEINSTPRTQILEDMRERITVGNVTAKLSGGRRGPSALIAFTVSFEHRVPAVAQKVANELVTLFLDENIRSRTARAEETTDFLKKEGERLRVEIERMELQIADFEQENRESLPETLRLNIERLVDLKAALSRSENELLELADRKKLLSIELQTLQYAAEREGSIEGLSPEQRQQKQELANLQNQYISLAARYGAEHPDVKAIKRQIEAFETEYGVYSDDEELKSREEEVRQEIAELTGKYSSEHPDVKRLERKLESIVAMIADSDRAEENPRAPEEAGTRILNPEKLQIEAKLESIDNSIERIRKTRSEQQALIVELDARISQTPQVERGLDALRRDYENIRRKYQDIKAKELQAELSKSLETEQKGERFTLLEPPLRPDKPVKPDRFKLGMLGLALSFGSGFGLAFVAEVLDGGIRGSRALAAVTRMTPLVTIPHITTRRDAAIRRRNLRILFVILVLLALAFIISVHLFYKPLDMLWYIVLRKLNLT